MKKIIFAVTFGVVAILVCITGYFYWQEKTLADGKIVSGIKVAGKDIGDMSFGDATKVIKEREKQLLANSIKIKYQDKQWTLPYSAVTRMNSQEVIKKATAIGRGKGLFTNYQEIQSAKAGKYSYDLAIIPNKHNILKYVYDIKLEVQTLPIEAQVTVADDNKVNITTPKEGVGVDLNASAQNILVAIKLGSSPTVSLATYSRKPYFTAEDVRKWNYSGYVSTFTTSFNPFNTERTANVKIAAQAINKSVILPGEEFSFNKVVGPRSKETGYKEALVIQNNLFIPGIGGGVCQVASTLYNNLLISNLKVVERRRHSLPVPYVSPGLDATVAYDLVDLRFRNNYEFPIIIRSHTTSNSLFIGLLGDISKVPQVSISTSIDQVILPSGTRMVYDPNLLKGKKVLEKSKKGYKVTVYKRIIGSEGAKTVVVSHDKYPATPEIIRIGTKAVSGGVYGQAH